MSLFRDSGFLAVFLQRFFKRLNRILMAKTSVKRLISVDQTEELEEQVALSGHVMGTDVPPKPEKI